MERVSMTLDGIDYVSPRSRVNFCNVEARRSPGDRRVLELGRETSIKLIAGVGRVDSSLL